MKRLLLLLLGCVALLWSCHKTDNPEAGIPKVYGPKPTTSVLILGNSITYTPANPAAGWNGSWGMAASSLETDYVHLLAAKLKSISPASTVDCTNISEFEHNFDTYNFDNLKAYRDAKPQVLIMRISENFSRVQDSVLFEQKYVDLLNYFKANNPNIKVLAAGSVWYQHDVADRIISRHSDYVSLLALENDLSNYAFGLYADGGIQNHPSDKGMKLISDIIFDKLSNML